MASDARAVEPEATESVRVSGAALNVVRVGPARAGAVIALHGGPGEAHGLLRPWLDRLASPRRAVVYYDQRGGGRSPLDAGAPWADARTHVADLDAVRAWAGVERASLVGFSWGALLSVLFALEHPQRVERLVLVSPPPVAPAHAARMREHAAAAEARPEVRAFREALAPDASGRDDDAAHRARFASRIAPWLHEPRDALALAPVDTCEPAAEAVWRSLGQLDLDARLATLRSIRTLVVRGASDPVPAEAATHLAMMLDARLLVLEGCGHAPFAEAPDSFFAAVGAFLDAARAAAAPAGEGNHG